jgi:hypothetical protein
MTAEGTDKNMCGRRVPHLTPMETIFAPPSGTSGVLLKSSMMSSIHGATMTVQHGLASEPEGGERVRRPPLLRQEWQVAL